MAMASLPAQSRVWPLSSGQVDPGAELLLGTLLNNASIVKPASAAPLGRNWFRLETDSHIFSDEVSVEQVAVVFLDFEGHVKTFSGKKSMLSAALVSGEGNESVVDFVSTTIAPIGIRIKAPYRASVKTVEKTGSKAYVEIVQTIADSDSNDRTRNLYATRYAQSVVINGKAYTYVRIASINDVNGSILPGAKGILESQTDPANIEALQMIIEAAKKR